MSRATGIVCTIGPASWHPDTLRSLIDAGMTVARLNFSHGTHAEHARIIGDVRRLAQEAGRRVDILQDLQGPKVRIASGVPKEGIAVPAGSEVVISSVNDTLPAGLIGVDYPHFFDSTKIGDAVLIDDGMLELRVTDVEDGRTIRAQAVVGGTILPHKGIAIPGAPLTIPCLTPKDLADLRFGLAEGVDMVALSFVRSPDDIAVLRKEIAAAAPAAAPRIVAKIERHEAVECMGAVIAAVDVVMVARGDLALDVPFSQVPLIQKDLAAACRKAGKECIVATQMLASMEKALRPTRAEATDVVNAVLDGATATMLSGETAFGSHPLVVVQAMASLIDAAEGSKYGKK